MKSYQTPCCLLFELTDADLLTASIETEGVALKCNFDDLTFS